MGVALERGYSPLSRKNLNLIKKIRTVKNYFADAQWHTVKQNTCICLRHLIGTRPRLTTKLWNRNNTSRYAVRCGLWVKCGTAECGMRKVKCGTETAERW